MSPKAGVAMQLKAEGLRLLVLHGIAQDGKCTCADRDKPNHERTAGKHPVNKNWQNAPQMTDEEIEAAWPETGWRSVYNIGVATGRDSNLFVLDIDTDNGGGESVRKLQEQNAPLETNWAQQTGSGGYHLGWDLPPDFEPTNRRGGLKEYAGLDIRGQGGLIVVAPSVSGKGPYKWLKRGQREQAPGWFLDLLRPPAPAPAPAPIVAAPVIQADEAETARLERYAQTVRDGEVAGLTAMREAATLAGVGYRGEGWDDGTFSHACNLMELANSEWSDYTVEMAYADVMQHAPTDPGFTSENVNRKWQQAVSTVDGRGRPYPVARPDALSMVAGWAAEKDVQVDPALHTSAGGTVTQRATAGDGVPADPGDGGSRGGMTAPVVVQWVEEHYDVAVTPSGETFAVPRTGPRLVTMLGERGGHLRDAVTAALYDATGQVVGTKAVEDAFRVVLARARRGHRVVTLHLRVAQAQTLVIDLGQPDNARCVVITPQGWTVPDNPPDGMLFRRTAATRPLPEPAEHGSLEPLRELLGFEVGSAVWDLCRGWVVGATMPHTARPLVCAIGAPGSGKSTRGKLLLGVLDPREELGSAFGKNIGDDQVKALGRFHVGYDNLSAVSEAVSDHVCRLVTGDEIDKRKLYSDTGQVILSYRRTGVITAVTLPALRPDALERTIPLHLDRLPEGQRRSETRLMRDFTERHPMILGGLCDALVTVLRDLPRLQEQDVPRPRMADYFDVLRAYDPATASAYVAAVKNIMVEAAEADPFVSTVAAWLRTVGLPWRGTATQAHQEAAAYRQQVDLWSSAWWPRSAAAFSAALAKATEPLHAIGITVSTRRSNGIKLLVCTGSTVP